MHDVYNVLRTNANHHYIFIMIVNVKSTTTRGMLLEWCRRVKYVVHWKGCFFQVVARFVWRIIIDDVSINRQWEVRMGVQKTITENPLHSSLCYIPLWSLFSLHTILVISFTTGLKRCNSCLKTMTVHLKTAHMGWLHVWPHPNMPLHRCQAPILVLHTLLVCEIGEGKRNCSTQFLRNVSTTQFLWRWCFSIGSGGRSLLYNTVPVQMVFQY